MSKNNHKKHKNYVAGCPICQDIVQYCGYAHNEGYADFEHCLDKRYRFDNPHYTKKGWREMEEYFNKAP